jgi:putative transcriptional regulator
MSEPAGAHVTAGDLLVATPLLLDPNFERSVVLVLDADDDGALGVVLNRPSQVPVEEILPDWGALTGSPDVLFQGGPVSTDSALAVGASATTRGPEGEPVGFRRLYDGVGIVDLDTPTAIVGPALTHLRIFAGYAGWSAGQLQAEIQQGMWHVTDAEYDDVFGRRPLDLWRTVLRRQHSDMAFFSTWVEDPDVN